MLVSANTDINIDNNTNTAVKICNFITSNPCSYLDLSIHTVAIFNEYTILIPLQAVELTCS